MDETTIRALIASCRSAPDPRILGLLLEHGPGAGLADDVSRLLSELPQGLFDDEDLRRAAARHLLDDQEYALARDLLLGRPEGPDRLLLAHALLHLEEAMEAKGVYERLLVDSPQLQDRDFEIMLAAMLGGEERERLANVISIASRREAKPKPATSASGGAGTDAAGASGAATVSPFARPSMAEARERITFADIGGLEEVKAQVRRRIILPFQKPSLFERFRRKSGGGVLLYGPPGCGKTMLARATAGECGARFISVAIAEVLDMYIGESEKRLTALFAEARRETPSVLFFDEIEAFAARRRYGTHDSSASLVSTFLSELDGFSSNNTGVLVLAATNVPWAVDSAFRRPGRFDRMHFVPPPDREARAHILSLLLAEVPGGASIDVAELAGRTSGLSGADLRLLVETASDMAIDASIESGTLAELDPRMMKAALGEVRPSTIEWLTTARNYARYSNQGGQYDDVVAFLEKNSK
ncbi:MAG: AAA family ATPase [Rhizobiales bacterium]|nr:AAA family ATPase [Hyphomicrobiales bacterium]